MTAAGEQVKELDSLRNNGQVVVALRGVTLDYGRAAVLEDLHLEVRRGEFWFLVGPNGSGKSTLLRSVLGVLQPRAGVLELAPELRSRQRIGFVPQRCDLRRTLPMMVREFVLLGLEGTGTRGAPARSAVRDALEKVDLLPLSEHDYWSLSGGQRQRALIARGLARKPELLILDEPTNGLDLAAEQLLLQLLVSLNRDAGVTVLFVTHVLALAARFATHAALFHDRRIVAGRRDAVLARENLRRAYGIELETAAASSQGAGAGFPGGASREESREGERRRT
jgi:ABC-type Mn2+/Zn2+ transport system ATPase subunit